MKKLILITCLSIFSLATSNLSAKTISLSENFDDTFIAENISIFDARVRSLDKSTYVKELYIINFSETSWGISDVGFEGQLFKDDGKGNDLKANDNIYTSVEKYSFNSNVQYDEKFQVKSVMVDYIVSPEFKHSEKLAEFVKNYSNSSVIGNASAKGKVGGSVKCKIKAVSSGCIADWIWSGFGCLQLSGCTIEINW